MLYVLESPATDKSGLAWICSTMKTLSHHNFVQMPALLIVLSLAFALAPSQVPAGTHDSVVAGETLLPLRTGTANPFSYGLYHLKSYGAGVSNAPAGNHLVLMLRNVGARWVNFPEITAADFVLKDSRGRAMKLELRTPPQPMIFGDVTVLHIFVPRAADDSKPWTLRFKSNLNSKVPFDISISGIKP
jgi:hypothetical protein